MTQTIVYHKLWLLSEKSESAREIVFRPGRNLLAGEHGTGKSRILKHLVWALGGEPSGRASGGWDPSIVAGVSILIDGEYYIFVRQGAKARAAFNPKGKLLCATESPSTWAQFFADLFKFPLRLPRHKEGLTGVAGPEYALLPFYIDQEGGWGNKWNSFTKLRQFAKWEAPVFELFTGLRPQRFFDARLERDKAAYELLDSTNQEKALSKAFTQVRAMLPPTDVTLNEEDFAFELRALSARVTELAKEEDKVRTELYEVARNIAERKSELQMVVRAEQDLVADLAYLSKVPDGETLNCPTCGQQHGVSFRSRVDLASDAQGAHQLVVYVKEQLESLRGKETGLKKSMANVTSQMDALNRSLERHRNEENGVTDIVAVKSVEVIEHAYDRTRRVLNQEIYEQSTVLKTLNAELLGLANKDKEKEVRAAFKAAMKAHSDRLNVSDLGLSGIKIGARPPMASGSSGMRINLAMHLALLEVNAAYGSGPRFPFIVDMPSQQGLDGYYAAELLNAIFSRATAEQTLVASECVPFGLNGLDDINIIHLDGERQVLSEDEYAEGVRALSPLVNKMRDAIREERERAAENNSAHQEDAAAETPPPADVDEDEDDEN